MKEFIVNNLMAENYTSFGSVLFKLLMSLVIASMIYAAYYYSSSKVTYNSNFNFSLVAMAVITTAIMSVISSSIALSLGMVGALSIIRFRTAIKDPKDAMFIFWSIMVGICCGVSQYAIAMACTVILFFFYMFAKTVKEEKRYILIVKCGINVMDEVKALTYRYFPNSRISVQNTTEDRVEFIYELKHFKDESTEEYLKNLYKLKDVSCANLVLQEDKTNI